MENMCIKSNTQFIQILMTEKNKQKQIRIQTLKRVMWTNVMEEWLMHFLNGLTDEESTENY